MPKGRFTRGRLKIDDLETPGEWLLRALSACGSSQAALARFLACNRSQVNRWIKGSETIPDHALDDISSYLRLPPEAHAYAMQINRINTKCERLVATLNMSSVLTGQFPSIIYLVAYTLFDSIAECDKRNIELSLNDRLHYIALYLSDAMYAIRCIDRIGHDDAGYLIAQTDGNRHIRFPMNVLIGNLVQMPARYPESSEVARFATYMLDNLALIAQERPHSNLDDDLARQHAIHMLTRVGPEEHQQSLSDAKALSDIFTRRMVLFGEALRRKDERSVQSIVHAMDHDDRFRRAVVVFDAVHYGDVLPSARFPRDFAELQNLDATVFQIINTALKEKNEHLLDFNLKKLVVILNEFGRIPFINNINTLKQLLECLVNEWPRNYLRAGFIDSAYMLLNEYNKY